MKNLKVLSLVPALGLLAAPVHAAVFAADFETLVANADLNGQGGWTTTETAPDATYVIEGSGPFGTKSGFVGFVDTVSSSEVYVKNSFGGVTNLSNAQFSVLFQVFDSTNGGQSERDTFGFRLKDSAGTNLFSLFLNPEAQSANPDGTTGKWKFGYTTGSGSEVPFYSNPEQTLVWAADESEEYDMTISFAQLGLSGDVQMNVSLNGFTIGGGVLSGVAASSINEVGVFWRPTSGPSSPGDNGIAFDNITVVPEPGIASLAGIAGLLCLMARRRA
jgi:hypothetical protein